jgi:hypothetical protein
MTAQLIGKAATVSLMGEMMMGSALGVVGAAVWTARISLNLLRLTVHCKTCSLSYKRLRADIFFD